MGMQILKLSADVFLTCLAGALIGCTGGTVVSDLPPSHPAHPQAPEAAYRPPPNPFQSGLSEIYHPDGAEKKPAGKAEHQGKMGGDHAGHSVERGPESRPAVPSGMDHTKPEHGGHDQ